MSQNFESKSTPTREWPKPSLEDIYGKGSSRRTEEHAREDSNVSMTSIRGSTLGIPDRSYTLRGSTGTPKMGPLSPRFGGTLSSANTSPNGGIGSTNSNQNVTMPPLFFHPSYSVYSKIGMDAMIQTFEQKQLAAANPPNPTGGYRGTTQTISRNHTTVTATTTNTTNTTTTSTTSTPTPTTTTTTTNGKNKRDSNDNSSGEEDNDNKVDTNNGSELNGNTQNASTPTTTTFNHQYNKSTMNGKGNANTSSMFGLLVKPENMTEEQWAVQIFEYEANGEWIEARESLSGRILWFNSKSFRIVFDNPPPGVTPVPATMLAKSLGTSYANYLATRPIEPYKGEDVVDTILNFPSHEWDFDNDMVDVYRSRASRVDHAELLPEARLYCFPEYFSEGPLRDMQSGRFLARIRIPKHFAEHRQFVTIQIEALVTTAQNVIELIMKRLDEPYKSNADPDSFILKVAGFEEYIYGDTKVIEYEAVRSAVRNEDDVEFVLVQREDRDQVIEQERQKQIEYSESFVNAYEPKVRDELFIPEDRLVEQLDVAYGNGKKQASEDGKDNYDSNNSNTKKELEDISFLGENVQSLYDTEWYFRVKVVQLMNVLKCPRFDEKSMRSLKVVIELWHGNNIFSNCVLTSSPLPCDNHVPYGQWLGVKQVQYRQIPRETVMCIQVIGVLNDKTEECLAWCRMPLIDHRHKLRRGRYLLTLWEIPAFEKNKHGPKNDPYALRPFRYRGTNRDKCWKTVMEERQVPRMWSDATEEMNDGAFSSNDTITNNASIDLSQTENQETGSPNDNNGTESATPNTTNATNGSGVVSNTTVSNNSNTLNESAVRARAMKRRRECQILIEFDEFVFEVIAPKYIPRNKYEYDATTVGGVKQLKKSELRTEQKVKLETILSKNPLEELLPEEKALVWSCREFLFNENNPLPAFLRSVDWTDIKCIVECHKYLDTLPPPKKPWDAIEFLDYRYADTYLREKAIQWISEMHDSDLNKYLLQLVQCLKYENHHNSRLQTFLLERGLKNPYQIGHFVFWALKAEFHDSQHCERFGLIMEEYLKHAGEHARQLFMQNTLLKRFEVIADKIYRVYRIQKWSKEKCKEILKRELHKLNKELPSTGIQIPLNPRWNATKILVDRCRFMDSAKVPLWLELENSDEFGKPITVMFKSGDDLRQDMLTIQILEIMDQMWLQHKIDLHLKPYRVLATGVNSNLEGVGMLELVLPSITVKEINKVYGTFAKESIDMYVVKNNPGTEDLKKARENFARSCAGYCVATSVLGIGDRHPSNVLITDKGHFFHIDFGHFLGNFKKKMGMEREKVPLLFTPAMKYCIDQAQRYDEFLAWVADAFNILRQESRLLLVLFALMVPAGMPELMHEKDIDYFKNMLSLHADKDGATEGMHALVTAGRKDMRRLFDHWFHQQVH